MPNGALRVYEYAGHSALVPLAFTDYASADASPESGKHYTVFTDPVGQPLQIEDAKGQLVWFATRVDPYGHIEVHPASQLEYNLRWPGHYYDPETTLHYNRYRYYDPGLGRYLQTDPLGYEGSPTNLYGYPGPRCRASSAGIHARGRPSHVLWNSIHARTRSRFS
jgi:RHS repeat-associated protein